MKFQELAQAYDQISKESSRLRITELLSDLFDRSTPQEAQIISYLSLGTIRAPYLGSQFNYAEKSIIKVLASIFNMPVSECQDEVKEIGDLGLFIKSKHWPYSDQNLSIEDAYARLVLLQATSGTGSQEEKSQVLEQMLKELDSLSASYIARIITGKLRMGFSDMTLIDAYSWMLVKNKSLHDVIEDAYNVRADIGLIAFLLKSQGIESLYTIKPIIGVPIRPAGAERASSAEEIFKRIGPCIAQPKLDGFRLQIHIDRNYSDTSLWFYSRNLQDMSHMFPDLAHLLKTLNVNNAIIEGEAIGYDENTQTYLPFQETVKRKRKHGIEEKMQEIPLKLFIFDLLYLNGNSLLELGYEERRQQALQIFKNFNKDSIQVIQEHYCQNVQELNTYFQEQVTLGLEGIVAKRPEAIYQAGKRNFNWIKLKRVQGHLSDTIDAVILGYYKGSGRRASFGIGAFLIGIYNKEQDTFETIAKVGTGLTDEEWKNLKVRCDAYALNDQPKNVLCAQALTPDVWVEPKIVVEVLADDITLSPLHTAGQAEHQNGFALRFPRFIKFRDDKNVEETTSVSELRQFYQNQFKQK